MAGLTLKHIYKVYPNGTKAVNDFNIEIKDKEFVVFVGPSGCGKSTTLRMIAGLEEITAGELTIDGKFINDTEPKERDIAMVFQNYALYPHMTVFENMGFALKMQKLSKAEIKKKVLNAAKILGLSDYLDKKPAAMSGGQRQRVALGRAIVREPKVFLLDEPLSNLDAKLRNQMRTEITKIHNRVQTTFIYVTHDQTEAMTMGDRIVVMKDGFIQQTDTPKKLYNYPINKFVAGFIGTPSMNFFDIKIEKQDEKVTIHLPLDIKLIAPFDKFLKLNKEYINNKPCILGLRPESFKIVNSFSEGKAIKCIVNQIEDLGSEVLIYCNLDLEDIYGYEESKTKISIKAPSSVIVNKGDIINAEIDYDAMHIFDTLTEENVMPRVPAVNSVNACLKDGEMTVLDTSVNLPLALADLQGEMTIELPTDAITFDGEIPVKVLDVEKIEDIYLIKVEAGGRKLFVQSKTMQEKGKQSISFDFKQLSFFKDENLVRDKFPLTNIIEGTLKKIKLKKEERVGEYKNLNFRVDFVAGEISLPCPYEVIKKLMHTDRKIYSKPIKLEFSIYDTKVSENGFFAQGEELLEFKNEKFLKARYNNFVVYLPSDENHNNFRFTLDMSKAAIIDKEIGIRLV